MIVQLLLAFEAKIGFCRQGRVEDVTIKLFLWCHECLKARQLEVWLCTLKLCQDSDPSYFWNVNIHLVNTVSAYFWSTRWGTEVQNWSCAECNVSLSKYHGINSYQNSLEIICDVSSAWIMLKPDVWPLLPCELWRILSLLGVHTR